MGEYATYRGEQIKIGTCEDMYYLRHDQRALVTREGGSVDPVADAEHIRFRFPWPDEDHLEPGANEFHANDFARAVAIPGYVVKPGDGADHGTVQFSAQNGYLVSLPCPEASAYALTVNGKTTPIHRNGYGGAVKLCTQRWRPAIGKLVPVLRCGGCGAMWRVDDQSDIEEIAMLCRAEGDRAGKPGYCGAQAAAWWHTVADRVLGGEPVKAKRPRAVVKGGA